MNRTRLKVYGGLSLAALVIVGGAWIHQQNTIAGNQNRVETEQKSARHLVNSRHDLTAASVKKTYDQTEPNLNTVTKRASARVQRGISLAYNDCQTSKSFNHTKPSVKKYLGSYFGNNVLNIVQPQMLQDSDNAKSKSASMTNYVISYGQLNENDNTLPMLIYVSYKTPKYDEYAGLGGKHTPNPVTHYGNTVYNVSLDVKTGAIQFNSQSDRIIK